jgi:hypothetical protein
MEASGSDTTEREALERGGDARQPDTDERRTVWLDTSESDAVGYDTGERDAVEIDTSEREATEREGTERDTTDEWRIEPGRAPATVAELEERIDVALVTAEAAEEAAMEIGAASLEAAEQARRAAELAERASAAAARAAGEASSAAESAAWARESAATAVAAPLPEAVDVEPALNRPAPADFLPRPEAVDPRRPDPFEERIAAFRLRAERVMIRLHKLEAGADPGGGPSEVVRLRR